ncbi:hypothetical protein C2E23DRAFT_888841 [Lenzites betulinus]|nr:hypothetical protein C2E23DRAFT_888841 [Lenzites betulinus]
MPHRRYPSAEPCEIVPGPDESPCVQPGYGERPRLCGTHRREYGRTTKAYKTTSDEAEALYKRVRARDWTDTALWNLEDVEEAIGVAQECIATTEKEIRERQEHHRRFFTELHDGHEGWITKLRKKLREVEDVAGQLRHCKAALIREQQLREEEERLRRERVQRAATRQKTWESLTPTAPYDAPPAYYPRQPVHSGCIAYNIEGEGYAPDSRCRNTSLYGSRCHRHEKKYLEVSTSLRTTKGQYVAMYGSICSIHSRIVEAPGSYTYSTATQDTAEVSRYIELAKSLTRCQQQLNKLNGSLTSVSTDPTLGVSRRFVENMQSRLESIQANLLRPKPAVQNVYYGTTPYNRGSEGSKREAPPRDSDSSGGWFAATVGLAVAGIAILCNSLRR